GVAVDLQVHLVSAVIHHVFAVDLGDDDGVGLGVIARTAGVGDGFGNGPGARELDVRAAVAGVAAVAVTVVASTAAGREERAERNEGQYGQAAAKAGPGIAKRVCSVPMHEIPRGSDCKDAGRALPAARAFHRAGRVVSSPTWC